MYADLTKEELINQLILAKARLKIEKAQSSWLDTLADELRDGQESTESDELYKELKELKKETRESLKTNHGLTL